MCSNLGYSAASIEQKSSCSALILLSTENSSHYKRRQHWEVLWENVFLKHLWPTAHFPFQWLCNDSGSISLNFNPIALQHLQLIVESIMEMWIMGFTLWFIDEIHDIARTKVAFHGSEKSCKQILQGVSWIVITIFPPCFKDEHCQPVVNNGSRIGCLQEIFRTQFWCTWVFVAAVAPLLKDTDTPWSVPSCVFLNWWLLIFGNLLFG